MLNPNESYHKLITEVLSRGISVDPVRGQSSGTVECFGLTSPMVFDLSRGVPMISTKKTWVKGIIEELLWFLRGDTNVRSLRERGVHIWDDNAYEFYTRNGGTLNRDDFFVKVDKCTGLFKVDGQTLEFGDLNKMYGYQWRRKNYITGNGGIALSDPYMEIVEQLLNFPRSRQILLNTYDRQDSIVSALPPCHTMPLFFNTEQLSTSERISIAEKLTGERIRSYNDTVLEELLIPKYRLNAQMIQRSGDVFLGVPFNISSTAILIHILADTCNMVPGKFTHIVSNAHIYKNHLDSIRELLTRDTSVESYFNVDITWGLDTFVPEKVSVDYSTIYNSIKANMVV